MIERLMDQELRYGEPECSKLERQITETRQEIISLLGEKGGALLERLCDLYIRQGNAMLEDAFCNGFCTAAELMLDFLRRQQR